MKFIVAAVVFGFGVSAGQALAQYDYTPGFEPGAPAQMQVFDGLEGSWSIQLEVPARDPESPEGWSWVASGTTFSTFEPVLGGVALLESNNGFPVHPSTVGAEGYDFWQYQLRLSYDRFLGLYRATIVDNLWGLDDIYEGHASETSADLSNIETQTFNLVGTNGAAQKNRILIHSRTENSFILDWWTIDVPNIIEGAVRDDQPWRPSIRMRYSRSES